MEKNTRFFCEHCEVTSEHELLYPTRTKGMIQYTAVCSVCMWVSPHNIKASESEIKAVQYIHFLCGACHMHVLGKIVSEKEETIEHRGKQEKFSEITVECLRCHKKKEMIL